MTFLIVTHDSSPGPSASQDVGRGCANRFFSVAMLAQESSFDSAPIAESQGSTSQLLRLEVTGMYLNPNSLMPRFNRFVSPPSSQCPPYQETVRSEEAVLCQCSQ